MTAGTTVHIPISLALPEIEDCEPIRNLPLKNDESLMKKGLVNSVKKTSLFVKPQESSGAFSGEDDDDVVSGNASKSKESLTKLPSHFLLPNLGIRNNVLVKAFLRDRKQFCPSWSEAAESVFSNSHPFKQRRRNRSEEKADTQDKQKLPSRSSSESRCSPSKNGKKENMGSEEAPKKKEKNDVEISVQQKHKRRESSTPPEKTLMKGNDSKTAVVVGKEVKIELQRTPEAQPRRTRRGTLSQSKQRHSAHINSERLMLLKAKVECAIREHKVYSMTGHYNSVRKALMQRGWVEKFDSDYKTRKKIHRFEDADEALHASGKGETENEPSNSHGQAEAEIINRMLRNITEDLCWLSKPYPYCWKDMNKCDMVNRLPKAYFSNKVGLCNSLSHMQWYFEPGVCSTQYPRTYNISLRDEYDSFKDDFRLTACTSTLQWLVSNYTVHGETGVRSPEGHVDVSIVEFALKRCAEYVKYREHDDIDMAETPITWEHQWDHFLTQYYKLVNEGHILREVKEDLPTMSIVNNAQTVLNLMRPYWPQMDIEGVNNIWIVKPGGRCCGNGILIRNHLEEIMAIVNPTLTRETRYVVQKYIERPLLIYNTKFDIRQWFLVTNVYPLTVWMYKESYLRFCSSQFSLKNPHESIHLCNNAVQRRYKNGKRDRNLPDENMWDCYTFQTYLKAAGYPTVWEEIIYPGMKESFVGALLASQDSMERRKNCFELYGADFMISAQLTDGPWLIEINSNPAMDSSTSVTARMCPQVLEDIVKVVIDRRTDRNASTGAFELVFKQNCPPIPPYLGMSLSIRGKKIYKSGLETKNPRRLRCNHLQESDSEEDSSEASEVNIVQKRCNGDFMQPIKTLREEIERLGSRASKEDYLGVPEELYSDSAANDTDTSRGSCSGRHMALEGKEMPLKKKKTRKRRHKCVLKSDNDYKYRTDSVKVLQEQIKGDLLAMRKKGVIQKTDWVRKNIDKLRATSLHLISKHESIIADKQLSQNQEHLNIFKDYILSGQCLEEFKAANKESHDVLENIFKNEMQKIVLSADNSAVINGRISQSRRSRSTSREKFCRSPKEEEVLKPRQGPMIIAGLWEPAASKSEPDNDGDSIANGEKSTIKTSGTPKCHLMVEGVASGRRDSSNDENDKPLSYCSSLEFDKSSIIGDRTISDRDNMDSSRSPSICSGLDEMDPNGDFESESGEGQLKRKCFNRDFTKALNITAPDLILKDKGKCNKRTNGKSSMEYFREWKYKIDETRRNCEDMLTKLKYFKENNSRVKFQDVLNKRMEEEATIVQKMKQFKLANGWKNITLRDETVSKQLIKPNIEQRRVEEKLEERRQAKEEPNEPKFSHLLEPKIYAVSIKLRQKQLLASQSHLRDKSMLIHTDSGATRNVRESLPKVKVRKRHLLISNDRNTELPNATKIKLKNQNERNNFVS